MKTVIIATVLALSSSALAWDKSMEKTSCPEWISNMTDHERSQGTLQILVRAKKIYEQQTGRRIPFKPSDYVEDFTELIGGACLAGVDGGKSIGEIGQRIALAAFRSAGW